jgi:cytidylate kinase
VNAQETIVVAIDGPSGVGKSTIASEVARRLRLPYLETGAMYRALGWKILQTGTDPRDRQQVETVAEGLDLRLSSRPDGSVVVLLDGEPLNSRVRRPEVSAITSLTSSYPGVRRRMVALQRILAFERGAVMEGRDIGTQVFPDTPYKFFLIAPHEVRVERRLRQLETSGSAEVSREEIEAEILERDQRDTQRRNSPLTMNDSYTILDTDELSVRQAVDVIVDQVRSSTA